MKNFPYLIVLLVFETLVCIKAETIFPIGCPLNGVSGSFVNVIKKDNCECEKEVADTEDCLDLLDEFHESIRLQDLEAITIMLNKLCVNNLNTVSNSTGETALLISSKQNGYISYTISLYLIEHGADVNMVGMNGVSPLINAVKRSNLPLVALLLLNGANIDYSDNRDLSPLFHSVISRNLKMTHFLLLCGSNPNIPDRNGLTPFYFLLKDGMSTNTEEFLELLLDYRASITDLTLDGKDAISFMIESGDKQLMNKLINHSSFSKYILKNNIEEEYISGNGKLPANSTLTEINRKLANARDKILRIITAIKRGFDRKVIFSLLLPELKTRNKDICIVRDNEGRNLLWWMTNIGDEELIKLLVNFYKIQTSSGILDFELCELHEPDIYGNLPIGHLIYNIDYEQEKIIKDSKEMKKEQSFFSKQPTINTRRPFKVSDSLEQINDFKLLSSNENKLAKFQILEEMLMFQNPKTNTTLWYELVMSSSNDITGEQKIIEYLSSPAIDFYVNSFIVRCFCKPLKRYSIPTPRSIPIIGTLEYDNSISILSLLLLLNKNYTSKVVLQSVLREAMLQSFWCIHALQHALITATILGKDDIIRDILLGRVQTLSEVLSSFDYSSEMSIKVASRLLGSLPPEFPNLDDLMAIPVTFLVRFIILSNGIEGANKGIKSNLEVDLDENELDNLDKMNNIEHNKIFQYIIEKDTNNNDQERDQNLSEKQENTTFINQMNYKGSMENYYINPEIRHDFFLQYQFDFTESNKAIEKQEKLDEQREFEEQMKYVRSEIRRGYFEEDDQIFQNDTSSDYESIFSNFDAIFSQKTKLFNNYTEKNDDIINPSSSKAGTRKTDSIAGALNLLKQLLSPEMTKFVRSSTFEYIIKLLQNSTCNYPRNSEAELLLEENEGLSEMKAFTKFKKRLENLNYQDMNINTQSNHLNEKIQGILDDFDYFGQDDMEATSSHDNGIDSLYKSMDKKMVRRKYLGNCLVELPSICNLVLTKEILWVPMILGQNQEYDLDPSTTLLIDSQCMDDKNDCFIPSLNSEYQNVHLGYIPKIPHKANITDLGSLISRNEFYGMIKKHSICDKSSSYTTFEELLAKKATIITLLNTSPHNHIIPSAIWVYSAILLTSLIYILLWATVSYFKVLYIENMINGWSKEKIRKRLDSMKRSKRMKKKQKKRENKRKPFEKSNENKNFAIESKSKIQIFTKNMLRYIRKGLLNTLPYSVFRLRDFAEIFPLSGSGKVLDSVLLALSLIFTSPWYVYKDHSSKENLKDKRSLNTIRTTRSNFLNAPINYFRQISSQESTNVQFFIKYLFFMLQIISLIYLFGILFLISEYDYIFFLTGLIITATLCSSVRIYYTHNFVSSYCNKYFCGFSKEYYLYNYYYYKKSVENRKNIRNIYSNLLKSAINSNNLIHSNQIGQNNNDNDFEYDNTINKHSNNEVGINSEVLIYNNQIKISSNIISPKKYSSPKSHTKNNKLYMDIIPELHAQEHQSSGGNLKPHLNKGLSKSSYTALNYYNSLGGVNHIHNNNDANNSSVISQLDSSTSNISSPNTTWLNMLGISSSNVTNIDSITYSPLNSSSSNSLINFKNSLAYDENIISDFFFEDSKSTDSISEIFKEEDYIHFGRRKRSNQDYSKVKKVKEMKKSSIKNKKYMNLRNILSIHSGVLTDGKSNHKSLKSTLDQSYRSPSIFKTDKIDVNTDLNGSKFSSADFSKPSLGITDDKFYSFLNGPAIRINQNTLTNKRFRSVLSNYTNRIRFSCKVNHNKEDTISNESNIYTNGKRQKRIPGISNNFNYYKNYNHIKKPIKLKKFKSIISSTDDHLSCDNIKTNIGNFVTNNQIHKPLYRLVDEVSYNTPHEYFNVVIICKLISCMVAMSSNISVTLFKSNSYLIRDSTLYFLHNRSPMTVYIIECIFTYWISNLIFEILKGLIILLFFVKQRKRLCGVLVQHIPTQFKYSNVQEFIQIVSYWRSAIQHILYKNTKLWTTFLNFTVSINTLIFFGIGKIMFFLIYNKKNKILNTQVLDLSSSIIMAKKNSGLNQNQNTLWSFDSISNFAYSFDQDVSKLLFTSSAPIRKEGISTNLLNELDSGLTEDHYMHKFYKSRPVSANNHQFMDSISNIDNILNSNIKDTYIINQYDDLSMIDFNSHYYTNGMEGTSNLIDNINFIRPIHSTINNPVISSSLLTYSNAASISSIKTTALSFMLNIPQYAASYLSYQGSISSSSENNMVNTYSNCETIFLTMGVVMFIFSSYVIRLLYQINRSSVRTHSWLQNILHRTPPGAGIYIVIEKVLLVINSTPPVLKICGFDITEKLSGFFLYIFTPIAILTFSRFTTT
ncbi:ankyrin-related protein [Cryptosporidium ubiquitum]|uniref:Ankyrin-related protein n=1 Tax=Cryptosporidium ubiquitum TaxID=857276 RepID=A0A1J4MGY2_9CRYT|nr:ankyrin-related protein [Cryptosporidium ubiquitum]OII73263.1 ankyrin-related protein [Cryptosporidium ubiquitum]